MLTLHVIVAAQDELYTIYRQTADHPTQIEKKQN